MIQKQENNRKLKQFMSKRKDTRGKKYEFTLRDTRKAYVEGKIDRKRVYDYMLEKTKFSTHYICQELEELDAMKEKSLYIPTIFNPKMAEKMLMDGQITETEIFDYLKENTDKSYQDIYTLIQSFKNVMLTNVGKNEKRKQG